jgi:signal transduction histidine kinase
MGDLIDGLLAFSRLSRQPLNKQTISSADLVHQALESLSSEREGRQVEISMGELPMCQGDPLLPGSFEARQSRSAHADDLGGGAHLVAGGERHPRQLPVGC